MEGLLSTEQACEFLKMSKSALYGCVKRNEIPAFKFGRRWKFHKSSLEKWVETKLQESHKAIKQ